MSKHILVIDDQESMRSIIGQTLRDNGYLVTTAVNGEAGLMLFNQNPEKINLILADVNMPKVNGFEFLKRVKQKHPNTPVVFLSGVNEDVVKIVGKEYKVDGIIKKPFQVDEVLRVIQNFISK